MKSNDTPPIRRVRGKGKKPALIGTSIRLDRATVMFFKEKFQDKAQKKMREVLNEYALNYSENNQGVENGEQA